MVASEKTCQTCRVKLMSSYLLFVVRQRKWLESLLIVNITAQSFSRWLLLWTSDNQIKMMLIMQ